MAEYVGFLRAHIQKEDFILFPMAEELLDEEDRLTLFNQFTALDNDDDDQYAYRELVDSARTLARVCGQPDEVTAVDWHVPGH